MSAGLSAMLSTSAVGGSRATARSDAANEPKDKSSPFADLLGAGPAASKAAASKEAKAADDDKDSDDDRDDGSEASNTASADAAPALPAWLQALRVPPPVAAVGDGQPGAADDGDALLAATVGSIRTATQTATQTATLMADAPTLATSNDDPVSFAASVDAMTPTADTVLTMAQNASLDRALDALVVKTDLPTVPVAAIAAERAPPSITITPTSSSDAASSVLAVTPGAALDAYGEPLALDGPDAAIRLGERLRWLSEAGVQEARLQLHPRELGSIDVRIRVEQQTASVWFGADHPAARAALEASLPQLRERMAADGLQLGQAQIGGSAQFQSQEREANGQGRSASPSRSAGSGGLVDEPIPANDRLATAVARHRGLIDRYV